MKPGDLVRIRPDLQYNQKGELRIYNLFESGRVIRGVFPANQVGIFISMGTDTRRKVIVNGITGMIDVRFIEVVG